VPRRPAPGQLTAAVRCSPWPPACSPNAATTNVTLAEVARAAGVTPPALYRRFRDKQDLLGQSVQASAALFHDATRYPAAASAAAITAQVTSTALRHRAQAIVYLHEAAYLPGYAPAIRAFPRWISTLRQEWPELSPGQATFLVNKPPA
jgi:AcrR family transcriptional regulator